MTPKQITVDVTKLTAKQRKQIFANYFNQAGFKQFIKTAINQKTIYQFSYT
jgi:hypothetical protein